MRANYYVATQDITQNKSNGKVKIIKREMSSKQIDKLNKKLNKRLNRRSAKRPISEGEYAGYTVVFDLQFFDGGTAANAISLSNDDSYDGHNIGNSIQLGMSSNPVFSSNTVEGQDGTEKTSIVGGITVGNQQIVMNPRQNSSVNQEHEIFHTLGMDHPQGEGGKSGVMAYPPQPINQEDINFVGNGANGFLPKTDKKKK